MDADSARDYEYSELLQRIGLTQIRSETGSVRCIAPQSEPQDGDSVAEFRNLEAG